MVYHPSLRSVSIMTNIPLKQLRAFLVTREVLYTPGTLRRLVALIPVLLLYRPQAPQYLLLFRMAIRDWRQGLSCLARILAKGPHILTRPLCVQFRKVKIRRCQRRTGRVGTGTPFRSKESPFSLLGHLSKLGRAPLIFPKRVSGSSNLNGQSNEIIFVYRQSCIGALYG